MNQAFLGPMSSVEKARRSPINGQSADRRFSAIEKVSRPLRVALRHCRLAVYRASGNRHPSSGVRRPSPGSPSPQSGVPVPKYGVL